MTTALTQKERIAALEARSSIHGHEHELGDRVWAAKLDAIDQRLRGIERVLLEVRLNPADAPPPRPRRCGGSPSSPAPPWGPSPAWRPAVAWRHGVRHAHPDRGHA